MKDAIVIKDARVICPVNNFDNTMDVLISNGEIHDTGLNIKPPSGARIINAKGMVLSPGFIDLHCHLREPGFEYKETIDSGSSAAAKGGFTTICAMPNTHPVTDTATSIKFLIEKAKNTKVRVLPIGSATKGSAGLELTEMAEMVEAGAIGFSDDGNPIANDKLMRHALEYSSALGVPIIDHCEVPSLFNNGQINEGWVSTRLGLQGIPPEAEEQMVNRNISLAQLTGGWIHLAHISTKKSVEAIRRAKSSGVKITAEVTPHHLTMTEDSVLNLSGPKSVFEPLTENSYNTMAKVNPPLRRLEDLAALIEGLADGTIDIIATDHAPHSLVEKLCPLEEAAFGISNLETALGSVLSLVHTNKISLPRIIESITSSPANMLQDITDNKIGELSKGFSADLTLFDPTANWQVDVSKFISKGKNSPLHGEWLRGKVMATIYKGVIVYSDLTKESVSK